MVFKKAIIIRRFMKIKQCLPVGQKTIKPLNGGLAVPGFYYPKFGDQDDSIEAAIACVEVRVK